MKNNSFFAKASSYLFISLLLLGIFSIGFYIGNNNRVKLPILAYSNNAREKLDKNSEDYFDFNLYFEVWNNLKTEHVDKNMIKDKELFYGSLEGLAAATNDPYTVFMDPELSAEFYEDLSGTFEGIGAEIGIRDEIITIIAPLDGMPAQKAGLRSGDKVYAINGESALG